jgi:hypothetical protein
MHPLNVVIDFSIFKDFLLSLFRCFELNILNKLPFSGGYATGKGQLNSFPRFMMEILSKECFMETVFLQLYRRDRIITANIKQVCSTGMDFYNILMVQNNILVKNTVDCISWFFYKNKYLVFRLMPIHFYESRGDSMTHLEEGFDLFGSVYRTPV